MATQHPGEEPADTCRRLGWKVGDCLRGDEGYGPTTIRITAIGDDGILARKVVEDGKRVAGRESAWTLSCRKWRKVSAPKRSK